MFGETIGERSNWANRMPIAKLADKKILNFSKQKTRDFFTTLCGRDAVQIQPPNASNIDLKNLAEKLKNLGEIKLNEYLLRLKVEDYELTVFKDARAIIKGTDDATVARSVYAKYVGSLEKK